MSASSDVSKMLRGLRQGRQRGIDAAIAALDIGGEIVLADSREICPVSSPDPKNANYTGHSGFLRDSETSLPAEFAGGKITKVIGYNASYAAAVHENLTAVHKYPGTGNSYGQAKFLEKAIRAKIEKVMEFVANKVKEAL